MKRIVALDPGGSTGWAMWQDKTMPLGFGPDNKFICGQFGPDDHHEELYAFLESMQTQDFKIVCESFEFRQHDNFRDNVNLMSREYIGVAKLFAKQRMSFPVVFQTAGAAKGFIPDKAKHGLEANAKLKVMELYVPGKKHAMDAMRHLVTYMVQKQTRHDLIQCWQKL